MSSTTSVTVTVTVTAVAVDRHWHSESLAMYRLNLESERYISRVLVGWAQAKGFLSLYSPWTQLETVTSNR